MKTYDDQLFQLLSDFETWQDGDALNERRLVQHDLVLAHLALLYGGLSWNAQHFGLLPSSSLPFEIEEQKPVALSHLLALTATGKLLVCASVPIPECDNPIENKGLFAIARPLKLPDALQKTWPDFPLYQIELEWQEWQTGIDDIVKTGEGLPLGRLKEGEWDADYSPPVMSLATDERLWQQATEIKNQVSSVANRDNRVAEQVLTLQQSELSQLGPSAFWQAHCRCLVGLKNHPKLVDDADYQDSVSKLLSETFSPWAIGDGLEPLRLAWQRVEQGLDKKEKPAPKPRRYVSLAWYATSMVGMVLLAILMLFQLKADFEKQLAALDNKQAETAKKLSEQFTNVENKLNEIKEFAKTHHHKLKELKKSEVFRDTLKDGTLGPEMVVIPAGTFRMGDIQGGGYNHEQPVHEVSIKSFAMGRYEVTFAEYDKFAEATDRKKPDDQGWGRGNRPVINVSWLEVTAYAEWLSRQTGKQYRLPTEAQWEYAARAGTETKYWWGNTASHEYANYGIDNGWGGLAKGKDRWKDTSPVGSFAANPFGLYDTAGNVWEWTCSEYENAYKGKEKYCLSKEDSTKDSLFVLRGGSW
ncbi:MAG: formylglycine-generating enzyme family protein, partial [Candidatus Parabeggiatoa sp.]|nr:formylglycine-generating enzyme family protein [Candidatus Parabeggiatoa sp.]